MGNYKDYKAGKGVFFAQAVKASPPQGKEKAADYRNKAEVQAARERGTDCHKAAQDHAGQIRFLHPGTAEQGHGNHAYAAGKGNGAYEVGHAQEYGQAQKQKAGPEHDLASHF